MDKSSENQWDNEEKSEQKIELVEVEPPAEVTAASDNRCDSGAEEKQLKYGEQLQDDKINSFCDKLQLACPMKIEGLLAIQFLVCEPESVKKHISGEHDVLQVLYDSARLHYVLLHYSPITKDVTVFDSLQIYTSDKSPSLNDDIIHHIYTLFAHLFNKTIPITFDRNFEQQSDNFSCGYRSIGAIIDIARGRNPSEKGYSRSSILDFMQKMLDEPKPDWKHFRDAKIHKTIEKKYGREEAKVTMQLSMQPIHTLSSQSNVSLASRLSTFSSAHMSRGSTSSASNYRHRLSSGSTSDNDNADEEDDDQEEDMDRNNGGLEEFLESVDELNRHEQQHHEQQQRYSAFGALKKMFFEKCTFHDEMPQTIVRRERKHEKED